MYIYTCNLQYYLKSGKELEVFQDSEPVKQDIVLGADSQILADLVHVSPDVIAIDHCRTSRGCI